MNKELAGYVSGVFGELRLIPDWEVFKIIGNRFWFPVEVNKRINRRLSRLGDDQVPTNLVGQLREELIERGAELEMDHIGVWYWEEDQNEERRRLINEASEAGVKLWEMKSSDKSLWLFMGEAENDGQYPPMLELLPMPIIKDIWLDYYLPHLQIDLRTGVDESAIKESIGKIFGKLRRPIPISVIDGVTYGIRVRLGAIGGVNIDLDFATKHRNVPFSRNNLLFKLN